MNRVATHWDEWLRKPAYHERTIRIEHELAMRADTGIDYGFDQCDTGKMEAELESLERLDQAYFLWYGRRRTSSQSMTKHNVELVLKSVRCRPVLGTAKTTLGQVNRELRALGLAEID